MSSARSDLMEIKTIVDSRAYESPSAAAANKRQSSMASPVLARHANRQFRLTLYIQDDPQCMSNAAHVNCDNPPCSCGRLCHVHGPATVHFMHY